MLESAFEAVNKAGDAMSFSEIYESVKKDLEMSEEEAASRIGEFYTGLTLDGRFVALTDNTWDLRVRHTYDKVHIDVNDVYSEVNQGDGDETTEAEEEEYDAEVNGTTLDEEGSRSEEEEDSDRQKDDSYFN